MIIVENGTRITEDELIKMAEEKQYIKLSDGFFETEEYVDPRSWIDSLHFPAYLSFVSALSWYNLIRATPVAYTCATINSDYTVREFSMARVVYKSIPAEAFNRGVVRQRINGTEFWIATPEKAVCDEICKHDPAEDMDDFMDLVFNYIELEDDEVDKLNPEKVKWIAEVYHHKNVDYLYEYLTTDVEYVQTAIWQ